MNIGPRWNGHQLFLPSSLVDPPGFELLEVQHGDVVTRSDDGATRTLTKGTTRAGRAPVVAGGVSIDDELAENEDAERAADMTPIGYSELRLE